MGKEAAQLRSRGALRFKGQTVSVLIFLMPFMLYVPFIPSAWDYPHFAHLADALSSSVREMGSSLPVWSAANSLACHHQGAHQALTKQPLYPGLNNDVLLKQSVFCCKKLTPKTREPLSQISCTKSPTLT